MTPRQWARRLTIIAVSMLAAATAPAWAHAQTTTAAAPVSSRVAVSVGLSMPTSTMGMAYESRPVHYWMDREVLAVHYPSPAEFAVELGAGIVLWKHVTAGLAFTHVEGQTEARVSLFQDLPHIVPGLAPRTLTDTVGRLAHVENTVHISAGVRFARHQFEWSVFGGPSYLSMQQDVVMNAFFEHRFVAGLGSLSSVTVARVTADDWGLHVGSQFAYYLSKTVGIGATVRYHTAQVEQPNYLERQLTNSYATHTTVATRVGGVQVVGGLRWRF